MILISKHTGINAKYIHLRYLHVKKIVNHRSSLRSPSVKKIMASISGAVFSSSRVSAKPSCQHSMVSATRITGGASHNLKFNARSSSSVVLFPAASSTTTRLLRARCAVAEPHIELQKKTILHELYEKAGQSPWYDNLRRPVSDLKPLIESGIRGITSNPTIFEKAIISSDAYDNQFRQLIKEGKTVEDTYWELVIKDIQDACDLFGHIYKESEGEDGYVSVEVSPRLAHETEETVKSAKWLHQRVNRPNVYIKIPATAKCVPSIKEVISLGISVNVTLIFSLSRYEAVMDAYIEGLESCKGDLSKVTSVASFFVSRVDSLVDKKLESIGTEEALALRGKAATAQAVLAYKLYQEKFSGPRWEALEARGARKQRLLWASTSVKNPAYPDTLYVDPLIGSGTVTTMPDQALKAFMDHGKVSRTIDADVDEAETIYNKIGKLGINWSDVGAQLESEGVKSFKNSFDVLLSSLGGKADLLKAGSA